MNVLSVASHFFGLGCGVFGSHRQTVRQRYMPDIVIYRVAADQVRIFALIHTSRQCRSASKRADYQS